MNSLNQRKTFEEGDEVVMKNAERKGVVTKRRGDFYNVVLEPTEREEENNVYAGDLVKASKISIKSSYKDFDVQAVVDYIKSFKDEDLSGYDYEFIDKLNKLLEPLQVEVRNYWDAESSDWISDYIQQAGCSTYGDIIVDINAEELADIFSEGYEMEKRQFLSDLASVVVHEMVHRLQNYRHQRWESNDPDEIGMFEYLSDPDEISAHAIQTVVEAMERGYEPKRILEKISNTAECNEFLREFNSSFPYLNYFEDEPELRQLKKEIAAYLYDHYDVAKTGVFSRIFVKSMGGIDEINKANTYGNVSDGKLVGKTKGERGENALNFKLMASEIADETVRKIMNETIAKVLQLSGIHITEKDFEKIAAEMSDELKGALASVLKDKKEIQDKNAVGKYGLLYLFYLYLCDQTDNFLEGMGLYNDNIEKSEQLGLKHGIAEMQKKPGEPTANVHGGKAAYDKLK